MEVEKELYVANGILTHNCYMPIVAGVAFDQWDVVFVDEAQDLSGIQIEMLGRMVKP
jgi:ATP-dependent exoDNAse (exonuclease V) beta subunit